MPPMTDARMKTGKDAAAENGTTVNATYNFAFLDEQTKRMIRRALLKAVAIPGYQVPFASREMPMPYGWGTGGIQVTASVIGDFMKMASSVMKPMPKRVNAMPATIRSASAPMIRSSSTAAVCSGGRWRR